MAGFSIIDGSNANIDVSIGATSYKNQFSYWSADIVRDFYEATTFASGGWRSRTPGMRQLVGRCDGYVSKGEVSSDPSLTMGTTTPAAFVLTADTGCTFTFSGHIGRSHTGMRAAANSEFGVDYESTGTVTVAWVVA